ncbi:MAG: hypothetical protein Q4B08_03620 [Propionibacteriaceae bacterium]|nr:hypothetical protein [Propionibacteriaceae bacterium]
MPIRWPRAVLVVLCGLLAAGCTGGSSDPSPEVTAQPSASTVVRRPSPGSTVLDFTGIGELNVDTPLEQLHKAKLIRPNEGECGEWAADEKLTSKGVLIISGEGRLTDVAVTNNDIPTADGVRVGMTFGDARGVYGERLVRQTKTGPGGDFEAGVVTHGSYELVFLPPWGGEPSDDAMIIAIHARRAGKEMPPSC